MSWNLDKSFNCFDLKVLFKDNLVQDPFFLTGEEGVIRIKEKKDDTMGEQSRKKGDFGSKLEVRVCVHSSN